MRGWALASGAASVQASWVACSMPRDIDVVGVWHGTPYQVASVSSTANVVIVACGPAGRHTTYPKTGRRHTKDPSTSTWYERQVLSDLTLPQPLQVIAFSRAKPPP